MIGVKDIAKFFGISIVACCAVFVCTLFLNYNIDLATVNVDALTEAGKAIYNAQVSMGKVIVGVTGGCLGVTSVILLTFYIKNYIDTHGKELGVLKAMGYSNVSVAGRFWVFGCSVLAGCAVGFLAAFAYLPTFYRLQNAEGLFPDITVRFHFILLFCLVILPTFVFAALSVLYALLKLKTSALDLLRERQERKIKIGKESRKNLSFLQSLKRATLQGKKILVFFIIFSAFCFSAMVQMSITMIDLSSETFAWMIFIIGLILAFMTLLMSLSDVVKGNARTIAMMRVYGYDYMTCSHTVLGVYRPFSYIGFAIGTVYQYGLLKLMLTVIFSDVENMPSYHFNWTAFVVTLLAFIAVYELILFFFSLRIKKLSLKRVMME